MKHPMRVIALSIGLLIVLSFSGCGTDNNTLRKAFDQLENQIQVVKADTRSTVKSTKEKLDDATKESDPEKRSEMLKTASSSFEKDWLANRGKLEDLKTKLADLQKETELHFRQLETQTQTLKNEELEEQKQKNEALRNRWDASVRDLKSKIEKTETFLSKGEDFSTKIKLVRLRAEIEANIKEVQSLSTDADSLFAELEKSLDEARETLGQ